MKRIFSSLLFPLLFLLFVSPAPAAIYPWNWGGTGVAAPATVSRILQLTDDSTDNLFQTSAYFMAPPWSKGGRWIVYVNITDRRICKMDVASAASTCLTDSPTGPGGVYNPSFGPGFRIYFEKNTVGGSTIWRMNSDGSGQENLTANHGGIIDERYVKVSPDGQWLAFTDATNHSLWVAKSDGTAALKVSGAVTVNSPQHSWSPDSQSLVYQGDDGLGKWIYKTDVTGTTNQALTKPPITLGQHEHKWPSWSPDGKTIAYLWSTWDGTTWYYNIRSIDPDGQPLEANLDSAVSTSSEWRIIHGPISWSPDSQWLTYTKQGANQSIFIARVAAPSEKIQLTSLYDDTTPVWSPAGNRILFNDAGPGWSGVSRDTSWANGGEMHDLLLLVLKERYGGYSFPWAMFLPAIVASQK